MMKKLIVTGMVATMVIGMAVAASAFTANDYWLIQARGENSATTSAGACTYGTKAGYADTQGSISEDVEFNVPADGTGLLVATDLGGNSRWQKDQRAPMAVNQVQVWDLRAYVQGSAANSVTVKFWVPSAAKITSPDFFVALYDGTVTADNYQTATPLFVFTQNMTGTSGAANYTNTFNYTGGYKSLTLLASTAVPEPGSILAMLSGLVGLGGFVIRRRK